MNPTTQQPGRRGPIGRLHGCLLLCVCLARFGPAGPAPAAEEPHTIDLRECLSYVADPSPYKTYVKTLRTPEGLQLLLDSPADHLHHHALMFAIGVDGVDFWIESPENRPGKQQPRETAGTPSSVTQTIDWLSAENRPLLREKRVVRLATLPEANLVTWTSILKPAPGKTAVQLWGRHYFGLGLRFVRDLDGQARFLHAGDAQGRIVRGDERVTPADWCACLGSVGRKPVTVAMFGHPANRRHPTEWFTMTRPFAYLSATLGLETEPLELAAEGSLSLIYGIALLDGHVDAGRIQRLYDGWKDEAHQNGKDPKP